MRALLPTVGANTTHVGDGRWVFGGCLVIGGRSLAIVDKFVNFGNSCNVGTVVSG